MIRLGGSLGYGILKAYAGNGRKIGLATATAYDHQSKLEVLMGSGFFSEIRDKVVIDFGCGLGHETVEMARRGAARVIGIDIEERYLEAARHYARQHLGERHEDICSFSRVAEEPVDVIVALDSFEHFDDPLAILHTMYKMLKPGGAVLASFGPTWYHPYGGHLFSVFPWAHLVFSEEVLMRWRSGFKTDGATRFGEVEGGLNQLTIAKFMKIVDASPFRLERFEAVPIRRLRWIANPLTREFVTSIIQCRLVPDGTKGD